MFAASLESARAGQSLTVDDKVEPKNVVVYAVKEIAKGALVRDRDIEETIINSRGMVISDLAVRRFVIGRRARYKIGQGQILRENALVSNKNRKGAQDAYPKPSTTFIQAKKDVPSGRVNNIDDLRIGKVKTADSTAWLNNRSAGAARCCWLYRLVSCA